MSEQATTRVSIVKRVLFFLRFLEIRLRFIMILVVTALLVGYWDHVQNYYERWQREHPNFHFVPVLSHAEPADAWAGRSGLVHEAMLADFPDMRGYEVYVCGSVKMVEAAVPVFLEHGLGSDACFSDAFVPQAPAA